MNYKKINYLKNRKMKKSIIKKGVLGLALALSLSVNPISSNIDTNTHVAAASKKDRIKPKIIFKGNTKINVKNGKTAVIPKTTYKDNMTKKKKLKLVVTVKKGDKKYSTIANTIRNATIKNKSTSVEFPEKGTYKIIYIVTDQAKNVSKRVRTVNVGVTTSIDEPIKKSITKQNTKNTTESQKKEEKKKENKESKNKIDLSDYADFDVINFNNNTYRIINNINNDEIIENFSMVDEDFADSIYLNYSNIPYKNAASEAVIKVGIGLDSEYINEKYLALYLIGKISAGRIIDSKTNKMKDLTDNVLIEYDCEDDNIYIYLVCDDKKIYYINTIEYCRNDFDYFKSFEDDEFNICAYGSYSINEEEQIVVAPELKTEQIQIGSKKLVFKKCDVND